MLSFAHKAGSVLLGLASRRNRVESSRRLLASSIKSMPWDDQQRWIEFAPVLPENRFASSGLFPSKAAMLKALPKGGSGSAVPCGVERAVNELILAEGYTVHALGFHPASVHDILIRKPGISK